MLEVHFLKIVFFVMVFKNQIPFSCISDPNSLCQIHVWLYSNTYTSERVNLVLFFTGVACYL